MPQRVLNEDWSDYDNKHLTAPFGYLANAVPIPGGVPVPASVKYAVRCLDRFVRASRWCRGVALALARLRLLKQRKWRRGCTPISADDADGALARPRVSRDPVPVQPRSACIRLIRVHLR